MKNFVILNEQHKLKEEQIKILNDKFGEGNWSIYSVPAKGWNAEEIDKIFICLTSCNVVFASPVPLLLVKIATWSGFVSRHSRQGTSESPKVWVFHNDNRVKKQIGDKIIEVVADEGWQLLR